MTVAHPYRIYTPPATSKSAVKRSPVTGGVFAVLGMNKKLPERLMIRKVREGLPLAALEHLGADLGVSQKDLMRVIGLTSPTLARRRQKGSHFTPEESDRLYRVVSVFRHAVELFDGDQKMAAHWLTEPARALGGETPLSYLDTEVGAEAVHDLIRRIEYGVVI